MSQDGAFLSPISIDEIGVGGVSLEVSKADRSGQNNVTITLSTNRPDLIEGDGTSSATIALAVEFSMRNEAGETVAEGKIRGGMKVSSPTSALGSHDHLKILRVNGVSILYGHFRSYIAMLCGQTPLREFYLPTISPAAYVELVEKSEVTQKDAGTGATNLS